MSSFDKVVKLACKPKAAPPKAKYLDPIVAATWNEDGAVHDVCKALVPRLREPNAVVAFKALIVLHTMIRNGATDNVLSYLSSTEVLRLRNVSAGNWEGYNAPQNIQHYALYLDSRIRAYRELKHDAIRVQAETNRDMRLHNSIEEDMAYTTAPSKSSSTKSRTRQRSKTIVGRKLRVMTVEKGLLRETKTVQTMIDSLVECRFYLDDLEDELTITALRMLVKDLLILFQAGNEGVINVLEHYFEMSKYDAEESLSIYRNFCGQTERVVEYLGVARKLQNLLNVPIPNLRHAPVSLASSLQEYLDDPNFEQNRIEYKASNANANRNKDRSSTQPALPGGTAVTLTNSAATETSIKPPPPPPTANSKPNVNQVTTDFFNSIEEEQKPMIDPVVSSPTGYSQQQGIHNPFVQRQMTGAFTSQPFGGGQVQIQSTGFPPSLPVQLAQPFHPTQPFPLSQTNGFAIPSHSTPQHRPFSTFIPQQATGILSGPTVNFLQPQPTGSNPFRQSMLFPQSTGMPTFSGSGAVPTPLSAFPQITSMSQMASNLPPMISSTQFGHNNSSELPVRPASTPLTVAANPLSTSPPIAQPVKSHQTGSRNPFGVPVTPAPPVPKPPTLLELSMGFGRLGDGNQGLQPRPAAAASPQAQTTTMAPTESILSTVASSFSLMNKVEENTPFPTGDLNRLGSHPFNSQAVSTVTSSNRSESLFSLSSQPTGAAVSSYVPSAPLAAPIKSQPTGFGGMKPFKPTSSFGASLLETLPPIPQSGTTTPDVSAQTAAHTSAPLLPTNITMNGSAASSVAKDGNVPGALSSQSTAGPLPARGFTPGVGLRPQATGVLGAANPFRATMFAATSTPSTVGGPSHSFVSSASTPPFGVFTNGTGSFPMLGPGNNAFGPPFTHLGQGNMQQQNAGAPST